VPNQNPNCELTMTNLELQRLNHAQLLAQHGLRLPSSLLNRLRRTGIHCEPAVSIEHQNLANRYVLRGVESGGAIAELGAYCSFVGDHGNSLPWLRIVDSVGVNGVHAIVLAPALVRIQVFRYGYIYDLLVTSHRLEGSENRQRPRLQHSVLFYGRQGKLSLDLWDSDRHLRGLMAPEFFDRSGDQLVVPAKFDAAVRRTVVGCCCIGCKGRHLLVAPPLDGA
jgi:hypothetical protein